MPLAAPAGRRRRRSSSSTPPRPPAACRGRPERGRRLLLRARRSASPPTAACGSRRARPPPSSASSGSRRRRPLDARRRSTSTIALENSRLDQTYNTPALATLFLLDAAARWMLEQRRPRRGARRRVATSRPTILYGWAEASRLRDAVRRRPGAASASRRHHRPRPASTPPTVSPVLRANGIVDTDSLPQARPQPAAHRHVPGDRAGGRRGAHPLHRLRGGAPHLTLDSRQIGQLPPHAAPNCPIPTRVRAWSINVRVLETRYSSDIFEVNVNAVHCNRTSSSRRT